MKKLTITFESAKKTAEKFINSEWMEQLLYCNVKQFLHDKAPREIIECTIEVCKNQLLHNYMTIITSTAYLASKDNPKSPVAVTNLVVHVMDEYYDVTVENLRKQEAPFELADVILRLQQYGMFELLKWLELDSYEYDIVTLTGFEDFFPDNEKED